MENDFKITIKCSNCTSNLLITINQVNFSDIFIVSETDIHVYTNFLKFFFKSHTTKTYIQTYADRYTHNPSVSILSVYSSPIIILSYKK